MDSEIVQNIAKKCEKFSIDLYQKIAPEENGSFTISPFGVYLLSAIVSYGATDKTQMQLRTALDLSHNDVENFQGFQTLIECLNNVKELKHATANRIIVSKCLPLESSFKETIEKFFLAQCEAVNYSNCDDIIQKINDWCHAKTAVIFSGDDFRNLSSILLMNYAYFKGEWEQQFLHQTTDSKPFHVNENEQKDVLFLHFHRGLFRFGELDYVDAKCVELPYKTTYGHFRMVFIVPNKINGLSLIENNLEKLTADRFEKCTKKSYVNLLMPRFKIKSIIDMKKPLEKMGIIKMFHDYAEFDNMTKEPAKVQKFVQKSVIVVDEGKPQFATKFEDYAKANEQLPEVDLTIDRPFMAILFYKDLPLFYTRYSG